MISIKSHAELDLIAEAAKLVSLIIRELEAEIGIGVSTYDLDKKAEMLISQHGASSAFKGYRGFRGNICTSVNEELIHGIPDKKRILKFGDIISLDVGVNFKGYFADAAVTIPLEGAGKEALRLIRVTREALFEGINKARCWGRLSDISSAIQQHAEKNGYAIVREFVGHGIGSQMHEEPQIPNYGDPGYGPVLRSGMVLAIEPMINAGSAQVEVLNDDWTVVTKDRKLSAHFEHTICITDSAPQILTEFSRYKYY